MNYFAHAIHFLDNPYFAAGTGVPDWLTVVDRGCRVRLTHAEPLIGDSDPRTAAVAGGTVQHIRDDIQFHEKRAFAELTLDMSRTFREHLGEEAGYRCAFLAHLLVEVLLDASLIEAAPRQLEAYYRALDSVDPATVQAVVNRIATQPTQRLAVMIDQFRRQRILWDYLEDAKLLVRLNQVMRRVGFTELPEGFLVLLPAARREVNQRKAELLAGSRVEEP